jgi:hypothetical protein
VTKTSRRQLRRKQSSLVIKALVWVAGLGIAALVIYGVSQMSGVPYGENALGVVNFTGLNASQKQVALKAANRARCTCGCGLGLAECVATDSTCPIRESNIDRIKAMVRDAGQGRL